MKKQLPPAMDLVCETYQGPGRLYRLTITQSRQLSLFPGGPEGHAGWTLVIAWGSAAPNKKLRVRREEFTTQRELVARWRELLARRRRNGYVERHADGAPRRAPRRATSCEGSELVH